MTGSGEVRVVDEGVKLREDWGALVDCVVPYDDGSELVSAGLVKVTVSVE